LEEYQTEAEVEYPEGYEEEEYQESPEGTEGAEGFEDMAGFSEAKPIGGLYALFEDILNRLNSIKVSNINKVELGDLGISVRDCMRINLIAKQFRHPIFAKFFLDQALITTDSAMSREGWFQELFITSKKFAQKTSSSGMGNLPQQNKGWNMFSKPQANPAPGEQS